MERQRVLVVDDEVSIRVVLRGILKMKGCEVKEAGSTEDALSVLADWQPEVALLDIVLPGRNGIELLREVKELYPDTEVIMMTSTTSASTALEAMREGANDYLKKPFALEEVWTVVQRAIEKRNLNLSNQTMLHDWEEKTRELSASVQLESQEPESQHAALTGIFEHYLEVITRELGAERASLMVLTDQDDELEIAASTGIDDFDTAGFRVRSGEGIAGSVAKTGQTVLVPDVREDERTSGRAREGLSSSFVSAPITLCVPVKNEREVLGVINLTNRKSGEPFGPRDAAFVNSVARQLAVTIDAAQQASKLQKAYKSVKAMQDQLVFNERIKAVGQMAAGVAHDFNNILSVITTRAEFISEMLKQDVLDRDRILANVEAMVKTAWQGAETIKRIQDYTRIRKDVPTGTVEMNAVIRDALEIASPKWRRECEARGIEIELKVDLQEVPAVSGNVYELTQVVNNLIFNAVESMPDGGRLELATRTSDGSVIVEINDTGIGMDEAMQARLFEPFFTTKEAGQGLGSSVIYGIVKRHNGEIEVSSKLGEGTKFVLTFPGLCPSKIPGPVPQSTSHVLSTRTARILLVDDEEMVLETHAEVLRRGGHDVVTKSDGRSALDELDSARFDLVITDLSMKGLTGLDVARGVKARDPSMPVILLSGWAMQETEGNLLDEGVDTVLLKPCPIDEILQAVQEVIRVPTVA